MSNVYLLMKVPAMRADDSAAAYQHRQQEFKQGPDRAGSTVQ